MKHLKRICLGTVQFGMEYGINNKSGKPSKDQVFEMMEYAISKGIEYYDTAAAYGDAEEILGEYITLKGLENSIKIISKLRPNLIDDNYSDAEKIIDKEVRNSLRRLNIKILDGYLLHTPANFYNKSIVQGLLNCKEAGLIRNIGVSIYEVQHALDVAKSGIVDYIQIPYSIFDQRLRKTDFFDIAKSNNVKVFGRAAFLQGLMLMKEDDIPEYLTHSKKYLLEFDKTINKYNLSRLQASFFFSYSNSGIDNLVFGVDNLTQLVEDIELCMNRIDYAKCIEELNNKFSNIEKSIIFPSLWAKK